MWTPAEPCRATIPIRTGEAPPERGRSAHRFRPGRYTASIEESRRAPLALMKSLLAQKTRTGVVRPQEIALCTVVALSRVIRRKLRGPAANRGRQVDSSAARLAAIARRVHPRRLRREAAKAAVLDRTGARRHLLRPLHSARSRR